MLNQKEVMIIVTLNLTSMTGLNLCDYSDAYILVKATITVPNTGAADAEANNTNEKEIFKLCSIYWLHNRTE